MIRSKSECAVLKTSVMRQCCQLNHLEKEAMSIKESLE